MEIVVSDRITAGGARERIVIDETEGKAYVQRRRNVDDVLRNNHDLRNDPARGWSQTRALRHVAQIPVDVIELWKAIYGVDATKDDDFLKRMLNDADWKWLRTSEGQI